MELQIKRETVVAWDKTSGEPVHRALVWQDRRTSDYCTDLRIQGIETEIIQKTGLLLDPYFSATKIKWLKDSFGVNKISNILFGTIDSYLIWKLTNGNKFVTDITNASRTSLFNINNCDWDQDLLKIFELESVFFARSEGKCR